MPSRIPYFRPPGQADPTATRRTYERQSGRRADIAFYQSAAWIRLRLAYLAEHPLCARCRAEGRTTLARHVHHVVERKHDPSLSLSWDNLESLCLSCHSAHHARRKGSRTA